MDNPSPPPQQPIITTIPDIPKHPSPPPLAQDVPPQPYSPGPAGSATSTTAAANVLGTMGNKLPPEHAQPAGEFDHAIQYLNKIKTRYPDDPNMYKQFLEIMQTYWKEEQISMKDGAMYHQHEQRMTKDVYSQVQVLFKDATDLLGEFRDFLPEISGAVPSGNLL